MPQKITANEKAGRLFEGWEEGILWACLQGVMGELYVDRIENPQSGMAVLGDFTFFAGRPDKELVLYKPECCKPDFRIMVPQNEAWGRVIQECYGDKARQVSRYAIQKEPQVFDAGKLQRLAEGLKDGYTLKLMDEDSYYECRRHEWSKDLVSQFPDYEAYRRLGLGVVILRGNEIVSGASSYARYREGIEIEIDTKEAYRRQGLACVCGARLILECLERGLYPSWDAHNPGSAALAQKLGYHCSHAYTAYEIWGI